MATVETSETHTAFIMGAMLGGLKGVPKAEVNKANWTARGSEAIVEVFGKFYKITVEQYDR